MAFVFYDTETTGTDTTFDQILQFAAILTDSDFGELDRFEIRCRLLPHVVPAPGALRANRVRPAVLTDPSLPSHYEAVCAIADRLRSWSPAAFIGYNSLSFDETLLRQAFYQNLKPIYLTNTNRSTRGDVLRLVQATRVYAPDCIIVPTADSGRPTLRLDALAPANGFNHANAHDAMGDVEATIFMARLIKQRASEIWGTLLPLAAKPAVIERTMSREILSHTEFFMGKPHSWLVVGCGQNPEYVAQLGVFDLRYDPADYLEMSVEQLIEVMNGRAKAIRCIKANAQPILLPRALAGPDLHNLCIDNNEIERRARLIAETDGFQLRVGEAISNRYTPKEPSNFVEERIYDGFPRRPDEFLMQRFHQVPWEQRAAILRHIEDPRIRELGYRLIYTERPEHLLVQKRVELDKWFAQRMSPNFEAPWLTIVGALEKVEEILTGEIKDRELIVEVKVWLESIGQKSSSPQAFIRPPRLPAWESFRQ
jgi:exodeoxyribonuclease I